MRLGTYENILRERAKRDPVLQGYIDRVHELTTAEIDSLALQKWIKDGLTEMRRTLEATVMTQYLEAKLDDSCVQVRTFGVTVRGEIREWRGGPRYLDVGRGGAIEIRDGKLLWVPATGGYWFETVYVELIPEEVLTSSVKVGEGTKMDYHVAYRAQVNSCAPLGAPVMDLTGGASAPSADPNARSTASGVPFVISRLS